MFYGFPASSSASSILSIPRASCVHASEILIYPQTTRKSKVCLTSIGMAFQGEPNHHRNSCRRLSPSNLTHLPGPGVSASVPEDLHQENLVTSLDAHCPKPIESRMSVQPGLSVLTISNRLVEMFRHLERHSTSLCKAVDRVFKETRKLKKHAETKKSSLESGIPASERPRA